MVEAALTREIVQGDGAPPWFERIREAYSRFPREAQRCSAENDFVANLIAYNTNLGLGVMTYAAECASVIVETAPDGAGPATPVATVHTRMATRLEEGTLENLGGLLNIGVYRQRFDRLKACDDVDYDLLRQGLVLPVRLGGRCRQAAFDTGGNVTVISDSLAAELALTDKFFSLPRIQFGATVIENAPAIGLADERWPSTLEDVDLFVGVQAYNVLDFEFRGDGVSIGSVAPAPADAKTARLLFNANQITVEANIDGNDALCILDTGATYSNVPRVVLSGDYGLGKTTTVSTIDGVTTVELAKPIEMTVDGIALTLRNAVLTEVATPEIVDGMRGGDFGCTIGFRDLITTRSRLSLSQGTWAFTGPQADPD